MKARQCRHCQEWFTPTSLQAGKRVVCYKTACLDAEVKRVYRYRANYHLAHPAKPVKEPKKPPKPFEPCKRCGGNKYPNRFLCPACHSILSNSTAYEVQYTPVIGLEYLI